MLDAAVPEEGPGLSPLHGARFLLALPSAASSIRGLSGSAGQRETSSVLKAWARSRQSGGCVCVGGGSPPSYVLELGARGSRHASPSVLSLTLSSRLQQRLRPVP